MSAFTNRYTFLYVTILVLIITVLLTGVYFGTKERQDANRTLENASQILKAAGYGVDKTQVQKLFEEVTEIRKTENGKEFYSVITPKKQQSFVVPVSGKGLWGPICVSKIKRISQAVLVEQRKQTLYTVLRI